MASSPPTPQEELKEGVKSYLDKVLQAEAKKDTFSGKATRYLLEDPPEAGLKAYLREAFLYEWHLIALVAAFGVTGILAAPLLPLVMAGELAYLGGMVSIPKFRSAIDMKYWKKRRDAKAASATPPKAETVRPIGDILKNLTPANRMRFENLKGACVEMRNIARDVRGTTGQGTDSEMEQLLTGDLDRLLWTFLRYLIVQEALERFQHSTDEGALQDQIANLETRITSAKQTQDERMIRALTDSLATAHQRLGNYQQAINNAEFVVIELERIEGKIRAITEMTVNRQDPGFISSQVDSVVQSMKLTEQTISELSLVTGLTDDSYDAPAIMEAN